MENNRKDLEKDFVPLLVEIRKLSPIYSIVELGVTNITKLKNIHDSFIVEFFFLRESKKLFKLKEKINLILINININLNETSNWTVEFDDNLLKEKYSSLIEMILRNNYPPKLNRVA